MTGHGWHVAEDDELHPRPCYGHVHAAEVLQETDLSVIVGAHEGYEYHVAFLSLKAVNGVYRYQMTVWLEELALLYQSAQILHLCAVGGDYAHVYPLFQCALLANLREIPLQRSQCQFCLVLVYAAETLAYEGFAEGIRVERRFFRCKR